MAALSSLAGFISVKLRFDAKVNALVGYVGDIDVQIPFATGTGTDPGDADMAYVADLDLTSGLSATTIDLSALSQGGNSQNLVRPKYVVISWKSGDGTFFLDRGATNGYTGWPADGISVSKLRRVAVIPVTVQTSGSDKTLDYSETGSATVSVRVAIIGASA